MTAPTCTLHHGDCLEVLRGLPPDSVDLVFTSPPYEDARTYGIDFRLKGDDWVNWAFERYIECCRVSKGLVAWVVGGRTRNFKWSATPVLLMAKLHASGIKLRNPPIFHRVGVCGSGRQDWLRSDYEFIVCATKGRLPWSDNTAMGHPPKWAPGGEMSHRVSDGTRVNQWGHPIDTGATVVEADGRIRSRGTRPSHVESTKEVQGYNPPKLANPGNVIKCVVGGGVMGDRLCHENEAPFPEKLAEFFVRSFCPPGGTVLDPFIGSGTTAKVALTHGRSAVGIELRESQIDLTRRRLNAAGLLQETVAA